MRSASDCRRRRRGPQARQERGRADESIARSAPLGVAVPQVGYFHTGATSAIADSAGGYAAFTLFSENTSVLTVEYKINLLAPALGDHIEALGTVLKSGRTLTVCRLEVFGVKGRQRSLVAAGQQTLICVNQRSRQ
jgi:uncharacterized protein (TIGR00369 family)